MSGEMNLLIINSALLDDFHIWFMSAAVFEIRRYVTDDLMMASEFSPISLHVLALIRRR